VKITGGSAAGASIASGDRLGPLASGTAVEVAATNPVSVGMAFQNGSSADGNGNIYAYIKI